MLLVRIRVDLGSIAMKVYSTFPNLQGYSRAIRWFNIISRTFVGGRVLSHCRDSTTQLTRLHSLGLVIILINQGKPCSYIIHRHLKFSRASPLFPEKTSEITLSIDWSRLVCSQVHQNCSVFTDDCYVGDG